MMRLMMFGLAAMSMIGSVCANAAQPPAAVISDPPQDKAYPASAIAFALPTHGVRINAILFSAAGTGPHPTVILLHGLPGNDPNFDLARAIQRAGWNVLTFHYRGSWGSPGHYSFTHCREDGEAALAWLRMAPTSAAYRIDPNLLIPA